VARDGAIDGIGGVEIEMTVDGDQGDPEVAFEIVEPDSFFYDPRSYRADFSDARYMGVGKWIDLDAAMKMFPDKEDELRGRTSIRRTDDQPRPGKQVVHQTAIEANLVRLVDIWYQAQGGWCWASSRAR
jgi:hypothetical protein